MKKIVLSIFFFLLMVFGLFFSTSASNDFCLGDYLLNQLGLKAWQNDQEQLGFHYTILYALAFIVIGWRGAKTYLKDSYPKLIKRMPWIFLVLFLFVVSPATEYAKNTYYSYQDGLKAVEYHSKDSICKVETEGQQKRVSGTISLTNHSEEEFKVSVKLIGEKYFTEEMMLKNDQNKNAFILEPGLKNSLDFEFYIDKSKSSLHNGHTTGPEIELIELN